MDIDELLEVLGNESRRRILSLLAKKPCYVSEISYCLKMAPKVVLEHLEKLERVGIVKSFEEGRRRYYYIDKSIRLEITISPHRFYTSLTSDKNFDECMDIASKLIGDLNAKTISEMNEVIRKIEETQKLFSKIQCYMNSKLNEIIEKLFDEFEKVAESDMEKMVLFGLIKGMRSFEIAEEFGLLYSEVEKTLEKLRRKGLVEKVIVDDDVIWRIR